MNLPERRMETVDEATIEKIADRAVEKAMDKLYREVGKSILQKLLWMLGVATVALFLYMKERS